MNSKARCAAREKRPMTDVFIYDHVRTPRGRAATAAAYEHLGLDVPDDGALFV